MLCQPCYLDKDTCSIDGEKQVSEQELRTEQTTITQPAISPSVTAKTHLQDVSHFESVPETQGSIKEIDSKGSSQNGSMCSENKNVCSKCNKRVLNGGSLCAVCNIWLHFKCAGITKKKFSEVGVLTCKNCMETCKNVASTQFINPERKRRLIVWRKIYLNWRKPWNI